MQFNAQYHWRTAIALIVINCSILFDSLFIKVTLNWMNLRVMMTFSYFLRKPFKLSYFSLFHRLFSQADCTIDQVPASPSSPSIVLQTSSKMHTFSSPPRKIIFKRRSQATNRSFNSLINNCQYYNDLGKAMLAKRDLSWLAAILLPHNSSSPAILHPCLCLASFLSAATCPAS